MASSEPRGPRQIWKATLWSLKGLRAAWQHESSFRLEVYLFLVLAPLALYLGGTPLEKVVLLGALVAVLVAELINSAIEAAVDRFGGDYNELVGRAKDIGSAAVFVCMMNAVVCWFLLLLWPHLTAG